MSFWPRMPQFRESGGGTDWRQVADMFIPGNVWNSRTNRWRPQGMVAGAVGQMIPFGDMAVEALYANRDRFRMPTMPTFSNPFSAVGDWLSFRTGRANDIGRGVDTPEGFYRDRQRMADEAANYEYGSRTLARSERELAESRNTVGDANIGNMRGPSSYTRIGPDGTSAASRRAGLGLGFIANANASIEDNIRAINSRNGAQQER